jgi:hypothetical protein
MKWPLHQRRWVLQERVLSPRVLNFGPYLTWQCREKSSNEYDLRTQDLAFMGSYNLSQKFFDAVVDVNKLRTSLPETQSAIVDLWTDILHSIQSQP